MYISRGQLINTLRLSVTRFDTSNTFNTYSYTKHARDGLRTRKRANGRELPNRTWRYTLRSEHRRVNQSHNNFTLLRDAGNFKRVQQSSIY